MQYTFKKIESQLHVFYLAVWSPVSNYSLMARGDFLAWLWFSNVQEDKVNDNFEQLPKILTNHLVSLAVKSIVSDPLSKPSDKYSKELIMNVAIQGAWP